MSKKFVIETDTCGRQQFVKLKRSRSHGHKHHHHRHHHHHHALRDEIPQGYVGHEYFMVKPEEWRGLKERDHVLADNNNALVNENQDLRGSLSAAQGEIHQLSDVVIPDLRHQVHALQAENQALRCSVGNAGEHAAHDIEKLQHRINDLERENKEVRDANVDLRSRVRELSRQVDQNCNRRVTELTAELDYCRERGRHWKVKFEDLDKQYHRLLNKWEYRTEKVETYEDILRRHCFI